MKRIMVIGSGGAGKSTFARKLGERLQIEVLHLDVFHWRPGWVAPPKDEWLKTVEGLIKRDSWIMDGNFSSTLEMRYGACDTLIFLDMPRALCLWRVLKRLVMYRRATRPDMAEGCSEKLDLEFLLWVWNYPKRTRPKVVEMMKSNPQGRKIVWLRSRSAVEKFLTAAANP